MKNLFVFAASISLFLTSCGGWSENDTKLFREACEARKYTSEQCECMLEQTSEQYDSFGEIADDQENYVNNVLLGDCFRLGEDEDK